MRRGFSQFIRELKIKTFSGRRQLQPDKTSWFVRCCACSCSPPCRRGPVNLRSGPILAVLIHSLKRLPLKLGLIQTLRSLCLLGPDFGRNADWLLEQCHKIWLAVGINGSWKRLFLAWLFSRMIGLFWDNLYILWKISRFISSRFLKIYILKIGQNCRGKYKGNRKIEISVF